MQEYEKIYDLENLYAAYLKARRGKRWKDAAVKFEINLLEALLLLKRQLITKTYTLSPYNVFKVYEPKERLVMSNSYKDKVVQHSLCDNVLEPILTKSFITDNYASQVGKGTDFGLQRLKYFLLRYYRQNGTAEGWVLKCDIRKYFYNIDHEILKKKLRRFISCPDTLWLCDMIIDSTEGKVGIPIGNQSSQLFALLYLNGLDHYVKEKLGIKMYGRYMDDFYLVHKDKAVLQDCLVKIRAFVKDLGLELNEKTNIFPLRNGIDFLGFHTYLTDTGKVIMKLRSDKKHKIRRKFRKMKRLNEQGKLPMERIECSWQSTVGHMSRGNCYHLPKEIESYYNELFPKEEKAKNGNTRQPCDRLKN